MQRKELNILTKTIQAIHPEYEEDDRLLNFNLIDIKRNFGRHKGLGTPTFEELTAGLEEASDPGAWMKCEYCKKKELVFDTDDWIKKHRKCQQIDFIDRQSKQITGKGITKTLYYEMGEDEFEANYRKVMNYYLEHKEPLVMKEL